MLMLALILMIEVFYSEQEHEYEQEQENDMIARIWHGWTKPENTKAYEDMLRDEIFPGIARRNIKGYRGAELFIHEDGNGNRICDLATIRFDGGGEGVRWHG